jgi:hypothetical protein
MRRVARLAVAVPALAFFVSIMDYATFSWVRDRLQIVPIMWDQKENYASNGFAIAFALNVPMAKVAAPPGYTDKVLDAIQASGTNAVAIQGRCASGSASTTGAVNAPLTRRAAAISCRNLARNSGLSAYLVWTTLTATARPEADRPR